MSESMKRLLCLLILALALPAFGFDVFYYGTNFDTQSGPQYGQKVLVTPLMYSNSIGGFQPRNYTCGQANQTFPAGFVISNMLAGQYRYEIQTTPRTTVINFRIAQGTAGAYILTTADVIGTPQGFGFPSYADITNYVNSHAGGGGTPQTNDLTKLPVLNPVGTNATFVALADSLTNHFHILSISIDAPAAGQYTQRRIDAGTQIRIYDQPNGVRWLAVDTNQGGGLILIGNYNVITDTNGTPDTWDPGNTVASSTDGTNGWITPGSALLNPQPTTGYGWFLPALIGDAGGLTNINAAANSLLAVGGYASGITNPLVMDRNAVGTLLPSRVEYPTNKITAAGRAITYTNGGFDLYSTNSAFAGIWPGTQIECTNGLQIMILAVSNANRAIGKQIANGIQKERFQTTMLYSTNYNILPPPRVISDDVGNFPGFEDGNGGNKWNNRNSNGGYSIFDPVTGVVTWLGQVTETASGWANSEAQFIMSIGSSGQTFDNPGIFQIHLMAPPNAFEIASNGAIGIARLTNRHGATIALDTPFTGNGSGLTNVASATNALNAGNATNLYGSISGSLLVSEFNLGSGTASGSALPFYTTAYLLSTTASGFRSPTNSGPNTNTLGFLKKTGTAVDDLGGTAYTLDLSAGTNLNASQLTSGTIPDARISTGVLYYYTNTVAPTVTPNTNASNGLNFGGIAQIASWRDITVSNAAAGFVIYREVSGTVSFTTGAGAQPSGAVFFTNTVNPAFSAPPDITLQACGQNWIVDGVIRPIFVGTNQTPLNGFATHIVNSTAASSHNYGVSFRMIGK